MTVKAQKSSSSCTLLLIHNVDLNYFHFIQPNYKFVCDQPCRLCIPLWPKREIKNILS